MKSLPNVRPSDCALALAIPLTREQFLSDLANPIKDYASHVKRRNYLDWRTDEDYWEIFRPIAGTISRISRDVEKLGVAISNYTSLGEFGAMFDNFRVITLVTHSRFNSLKPSEFGDPRGFIELLRSPENLVQKSIGDILLPVLGQNGSESVSGASDDDISEKIVRELNLVISKAHTFYGTQEKNDSSDPQADSEMLGDRPLERLTRYAIEQAFPGHIQEGHSIEFSDQMSTVSDLVAMIPGDYSGLLNLIVCNSVIAGELIKYYRPACFVATNRYPAQPHVRMAYYKLAIYELARTPMPFIDAITRIHTRR